MTRRRKLLFSLIVVGCVFGLIEGVGQFVWWRLESERLQVQKRAGEEILRNDAIAFMKVPDGVYGYAMKPNFKLDNDPRYPASGSIVINQQGFHQRDEVPVARTPGRPRIVCLGESTTFGSTVDSNYPTFLRTLLAQRGVGVWRNAEVINAGVPGWISDQIALRVEHQVKYFKPDVAILYVGWNDFQSYNPLDVPPSRSYFEMAYKGKAWKQYTVSWLKSVALLSAWYHSRIVPEAVQASQPRASAAPADYYRFLDASLERIVAQLHASNRDTRIFLSTLVGRWPDGTPEEWSRIAPVWWMKQNNLTPEQAAEHVARFNDHLQRFARAHGLSLIDTAAAFERLDRAKLQFDWAHMTADGYELMAWTFADALRDAGVVQLSDDDRYRELRNRYASE